MSGIRWRCFNKLPTDGITTVAGSHSPQEQLGDDKSHSLQELVADEEEDSGEMEVNGIQINEEQGENENIGDDSSAGGSCLLTSVQDPTLNITQDNYHEPVGFLSTNAGDMPLNVEQSTTGESVARHVIFNHLGNCISRLRGNRIGSSHQNHYIQSLYSTIEGQSTPLLYPDAAIFTRHFYLTGKVDG